ncbi:Ctf8 [Dictyocaulus viviparus]|uniref:Ctf8 n=1 Tax=Dictyocaulus viviparus TaxID=29172 RepID=A0A0D8YAX9_DICVI|nr:Ctf8 [Dictyocaulus viviparus]
MQIELVKNPDGFHEHMLIELQGTIENNGRPLADQVLGTLVWRKDNSEALLLIGHQLLEGKIIELEKPFLILRPLSSSQHFEERTMIVDAIIKRKLLFKNRPKPLVVQ